MNQNTDKPGNASRVQVFEVTMDNPEDQDELNRRLRKPGDAEYHASQKNGHAAPPQGAPGDDRSRNPHP